MMTSKDDPFAIFDNDPLQTGAAKVEPKNLDKVQVANGGEKEGVTCHACKGRGSFISYTGRRVGACFKCNGTGKVSVRKAAAAKAQVTRQRNEEQWQLDHSAEIAHMRRRAGKSSFYADLLSKMTAYGKLTENQLAAVRKDMAESEAYFARMKAQREEAAPEVNLSKIEELFGTARANGLKKLKFRTEACDISPAPEHGRNAGSLYVTKDGEYFGKLTGGKFFATREAPETIIEQLRELAKDPLAVGVAYGRMTGRCCACGRELTDPVSVANGIGPICESNWGL